MEKELRESVRTIMKKLGILQKGEAVCCGVTMGQCYSITEIGRVDKISLNELAENLNLDKSTLSRTVDNLVQAGLVERMVNPENRRMIDIQLTPEGKKIYQGLEEKMDKYFRNILESIPKEKQKQVVESMELLAQALQEKCC
jgi:DNA-binding MarR family transcriptional regulator